MYHSTGAAQQYSVMALQRLLVPLLVQLVIVEYSLASDDNISE